MNSLHGDVVVRRSEAGKFGENSKFIFASVILFSILVNLLMLTGPLFMLQVYDRVLNSRSEETLVALFLLVIALYTAMAFMDYARRQTVVQLGARIQKNIDRKIVDTWTNRASLSDDRTTSAKTLRELDAYHAVYSSPGFIALLDLPWTPLFLGVIFLFHPLLGWVAVAGGVWLILLAAISQWLTSAMSRKARENSAAAGLCAADFLTERGFISSQALVEGVSNRWKELRVNGLELAARANNRGNAFSSLATASKLLLQSAMISTGAFLALKSEITAGALIAGSIILGRALSPLEQVMVHWPALQQAWNGRRALANFSTGEPRRSSTTKLPIPSATISATDLAIVPPASAKTALRGVTFKIEPGHALGVIGRSGAGKTLLAEALMGICPVAKGEVRIGDALIGQYSMSELGRHVGYLPEAPVFFRGTIAENIARMSQNPCSDRVIAAAKRANAHGAILDLAHGYDTLIGGNRGPLSGGLRKRIAFARALYSEPVLLILDEPNSGMDVDGSNAVNACVRNVKNAGKSVVILTHRPAAIAECDMLLVLDKGNMVAFGQRSDVLQSALSNGEIQRNPDRNVIAV